jgi:hypothetical protein
MDLCPGVDTVYAEISSDGRVVGARWDRDQLCRTCLRFAPGLRVGALAINAMSCASRISSLGGVDIDAMHFRRGAISDSQPLKEST